MGHDLWMKIKNNKLCQSYRFYEKCNKYELSCFISISIMDDDLKKNNFKKKYKFFIK